MLELLRNAVAISKSDTAYLPVTAKAIYVGGTGNITLIPEKGGVKASQTLTISANPGDTETVTIAGKVYTFKSTLVNTDGYVAIGSTAEQSLANLAAAINGGDTLVGGGTGYGAGGQYAAKTVRNTKVTATAITATTLVVTAILPGTIANTFGTTETLANGSWGASTLANGAGDVLISSIPVGTILPIQTVAVLSTGTSATAMVALY